MLGCHYWCLQLNIWWLTPVTRIRRRRWRLFPTSAIDLVEDGEAFTTYFFKVFRLMMRCHTMILKLCTQSLITRLAKIYLWAAATSHGRSLPRFCCLRTPSSLQRHRTCEDRHRRLCCQVCSAREHHQLIVLFDESVNWVRLCVSVVLVLARFSMGL